MSLPHALLTALVEKSSSGLELSTRFDRSIGYFWHATHQQIYRELARLEEAGWVESLPPESGRGRKRVYRVLPAGRAELRRWAGSADQPAPLRDALTAAAARRVAATTALGSEYIPVGRVIDEKTIVNGIVGLLATGGSTNHTLHLVAIAKAAGILIDWSDFSELSSVVPLLARVYPNGPADVNQFHAAGGMAFVIRELLDAGLLHEDVQTVVGKGLRRYTEVPVLDDGNLHWQATPEQSADDTVLSPFANAFSTEGGIKLVAGNLGHAVIKVSAVKPENRIIEAPAICFNDQEEVIAAFKRGELDRDFVAILRFQGPRANGMPELHKLIPTLGVLLDRGFKVALVTDGRMSGASGKVPAAIHVTPEAAMGGALARLRDDDLVRLDAIAGTLDVLLDESAWHSREAVQIDLSRNALGMG